jgi:excisionase family DNA binding protein
MSSHVKAQRSRPAQVVEGLRTLRVKDLAASLGIPAWRLYQMIDRGEAPPHFRVGKTVRFPEAGVRRWIDQQTNTNNANHKEE